jgi:hypothetical protein
MIRSYHKRRIEYTSFQNGYSDGQDYIMCAGWSPVGWYDMRPLCGRFDVVIARVRRVSDGPGTPLRYLVYTPDRVALIGTTTSLTAAGELALAAKLPVVYDAGYE